MLLSLSFQHYGSQNVAPAMPARFECSRDTDHPDPIIPNYVAHSHQDQLNRRSTSVSQQGQSTRSCPLCSRTGQGPRKESGKRSGTSHRRRCEYAFVSISRSCKLILFLASKSTPRQLVSVLVHTRSSWILGVPIPGLALDSLIILVQNPKTQGLPCQYSMAVEVSQARNVSIFHYYPHQSSRIDNPTECVL